MGIFIFGFLVTAPSQIVIPHDFKDLHLIPAVQREKKIERIERHKTL